MTLDENRAIEDPDEAALAQDLAAFVAADVPCGLAVHTISTSLPDGAWTALLCQIQATILPRRLVFKADTGEVLELVVADRRVCSIAAIDGPWARNQQGAIIGQLLTEPTEGDIAVVQKLLLAFCTGRNTLTVSSQLCANPGQTGTSGISVNVLRQFMAAAATRTGAEGPISVIEQFLARLSPVPTAFLLIESGVVVQSDGNVSQLVSLNMIFKSINQGSGDQHSDNTPDQLIILSNEIVPPHGIGNGQAILIANAGRQQLLIWLNPRELVTVSEMWVSCRN